LAHAEADLHFARLGQKDADTMEILIAFHTQQGIEKALKAVLVQHEVEFPKTHDLEELVELIERAGLVWPPELNKAIELTPFATQGRYPGFDEPITRAEVGEALDLAAKVLAWAKAQIMSASGSG
jgi:HEPN domain-containing protein